MLALLRSLHFSELPQRSAWARPANGTATRLLGKYLRVKNIQGAKELVSHGFADSHNADLCGVRLSVTSSCPPLAVQWLCSNVFLAHQCKPHRVNRVAGLVAEGFSMHERLIIFQSVSKNISLQLEEELKRKVWESFGADGETLLNSEWEQYR